MEERTESPRTLQAESGTSAEGRGERADAFSDASNETADVSILREPYEDKNRSSRNHETIIFKDHLGNSYIWPFELCRSYSMIKPLIQEVCERKSDEYHVDEVRKGRYDISTNYGLVILPSVWDSIVKPSSTIHIAFWGSNERTRRKSSTHEDRRTYNIIREERPVDRRDSSRVRRSSDYDIRETTYDVEELDEWFEEGKNSEKYGSEQKEMEENKSEGDDSGEDSSSTNSTLSETEVDNDIKDPEPNRQVLAPIDMDGNKLSFLIDTSRSGKASTMQRQPGTKMPDSAERRNTFEGHMETWRITKVTSAGGAESRTILQVRRLPGPEVPQLRDSVKITWYHIQAGRLDFSNFKDVCLGIPGLSDRLHMLTREMLAKVEKVKVKAFLAGSFIEPGTVIRADEKCQPDPQSVIFSCIPYFDLQPMPGRSATESAGRLFPPRTLMQSFYPYEPVRERDTEQAFRKFGDDRSDNLVYVPNLWMINIGADIVVTCGHKPLEDAMVKSIEVTNEDLSQLGSRDVTTNTLTCIRLKTWDGCIYLYPLDVCRSYFQMEQKLKDLRVISRDSTSLKSLIMIWDSPEGEKVVKPKDWSSIISRTDLVFIELRLWKHGKTPSLQTIMATEDLDIVVSTASTSVPPFFHWPSAKDEENQKQEVQPQNSIPSDARHAIRCLEYVEKVMLNETLDQYETTNVVDESFETTEFYRALQEDTHEHIRAQFMYLSSGRTSMNIHSYHENVVHGQCADIVKKSNNFYHTVQRTLELFVKDVDKSAMLRKLWGALGNVHRLAAVAQARGAVETETTEQDPQNRGGGWHVRAGRERGSHQPSANKEFKLSLRKCSRCKSSRPFASCEAAIDHLRAHLKTEETSRQTKNAFGNIVQYTSVEGSPKIDFKDWVVYDTQLKREKSNDGVLAILTQASEDSLKIFNQAKELADGVQNEDHNMSDLYTMPHALLVAFRRLVVFYLANERALYHTDEIYKKETPSRERHSGLDLPYSETGLAVLKKFAKGVHLSLAKARDELCNMAMPETLPDVMQNLSLGPEYVCGWLMRRLLVKPLQKRMTIGDMYREYLSTVQFQVNHRPGKRLIRSINLLQEELQVLLEVNTWQTKLVQNYIRVLDDATYEKEVLSRSAMFSCERMLLRSCLENLALAREEYSELSKRCGPLSDLTKQSLEINEEDHGKAIMVFTIVTVIFLPLSFVTSYLGMNTADIRDMNSEQGLFWAIAVPLTVVTLGTTLVISYNGDRLRDAITSIGKQNTSTSARGISVAQRKRARQLQSDSESAMDLTSLADEAEYADPRPDYCTDEFVRPTYPGQYDVAFEPDIQPETTRTELKLIQPRAKFHAEAMTYSMPAAATTRRKAAPPPPPPPQPYYRQSAYDSNGRRYGRTTYANEEADEWYDPHMITQRRVGRASAPMSRVRVYNSRQDDVCEGDGDVQDYTWHKKRRNQRYGGDIEDQIARLRTEVRRDARSRH